MTIDAASLRALAGTTLGPASFRAHDGNLLIDTLDREIDVAHEDKLVRCAAGVNLRRPEVDPATFDRRFHESLVRAERSMPDLVKLVYTSQHAAVFCYTWLGEESSVGDLLAVARRCASLTYVVEDLAHQVGAMIALEDQVSQIETDSAGVSDSDI